MTRLNQKISSVSRLTRLALITCMALVMLWACGEGERPTTPTTDTDEPAADATPQRGGELIVAVIDDASRLDPHGVTDAAAMRMIENIHATLLRYGDRYGDFEPDLAESVDISDDQLTYTITLRQGIGFHSGRPITSEDVVYSLKRIAGQNVRSQHFAMVDSYQTPDERTIRIELTQPNAAFTSYLAHPMNAVVDPEVVEANGGSLDQADGGAGPFKLVDWKRDQQLTLERFADYHLPDRPYVDRLIYRPISDETARTTALRTGEIHLIHEVAPKDLQILQQADGVVVESVDGTFWEYVGLNCARPPFDRAEVRQAVAWAVDRAVINELVKFGQATVLDGGHIPPNHWAYADLHLFGEQDPAEARSLMQRSGVQTPIEAELLVDSSVTYQARAAEVVKQQLAEVGLEITVRGLESSVFFDRLGKGEFQMTLVGWMGFVDPDQWTWNLFHSQGKYNQQQYANDTVDQLLDQGRSVLDRQQRIDIYRKAQRTIALDAPMVFLYVNPQTSAWRQSLHGYQPHPTATTIGLRDAWLDEPN